MAAFIAGCYVIANVRFNLYGSEICWLNWGDTRRCLVYFVKEPYTINVVSVAWVSCPGMSGWWLLNDGCHVLSCPVMSVVGVMSGGVREFE